MFQSSILADSSTTIADQINFNQPKVGQHYSKFQRKELLRNFLNNSNLTEDVTMKLCKRLGLTRESVVRFFERQRRKTRYECLKMYSELLEGEKQIFGRNYAYYLYQWHKVCLVNINIQLSVYISLWYCLIMNVHCVQE